MASIPRIRDRSKQGWFMRLLENLRSEVRWLDLFVGAGAALLISALLLDFRYQAVPDYKVGDIAQQDLRAIQDVTFEDRAATESKRRAAWIGTAALYDLDTSLMQRRAGRALQSFRPPPGGFWKRRRSLQKVRLIVRYEQRNRQRSSARSRSDFPAGSYPRSLETPVQSRPGRPDDQGPGYGAPDRSGGQSSSIPQRSEDRRGGT